MTVEASNRLDVLGEGTERLQVISGALLETALDDPLQAIALEASRRLSMPIALVALLLRRMQFYRAYVGLPKEVEILRATDRCVGLCQHVLRAGGVVALDDVRQAPVSQLLVDRYGVRAYIGAPVTVGGRMLGTMCCIDLEPRRFSDEDRAIIVELAARASRRLTELAAQDAPFEKDGASSEVAREDVDRLASEVALARVSALELSSGVRLLEQAMTQDPTRYAAWLDLPRAHADLAQSLAQLENTVRHLRATAAVKR